MRFRLVLLCLLLIAGCSARDSRGYNGPGADDYPGPPSGSWDSPRDPAVRFR
jgi:hypothetical protein